VYDPQQGPYATAQEYLADTADLINAIRAIDARAGAVLVFEQKFAFVTVGFMPLLGLKHGRHECDVISVVAEFMVDVAGVETRPPCV
jgi:hypothetical protein